MAKAMKNGSMDPFMTDNTTEDTNMVKEAFRCQMALSTRGHGNIIGCKVRDSTNGRMEIHTMDFGRTIRCMVMDYLLG